MTSQVLTETELKARIYQIGRECYHHRHPFHEKMHAGALSKAQLQAWALNRYYYQSIIPLKDAVILSRAKDPALRRAWRKRIEDHDGKGELVHGGLEKWIRLAEATGLSREEVLSERRVLPGVRFAVDAYLKLVSEATLLEAIASSLTELFASELIAVRVRNLKQFYPWIASGLEYFQDRLTQAPEDASFALKYVCDHARTREDQERSLCAIEVKCEILWAQLDAIHHACVEPGSPPPGYGSV